jgi:hypothetical protein
MKLGGQDSNLLALCTSKRLLSSLISSKSQYQSNHIITWRTCFSFSSFSNLNSSSKASILLRWSKVSLLTIVRIWHHLLLINSPFPVEGRTGYRLPSNRAVRGLGAGIAPRSWDRIRSWPYFAFCAYSSVHILVHYAEPGLASFLTSKTTLFIILLLSSASCLRRLFSSSTVWAWEAIASSEIRRFSFSRTSSSGVFSVGDLQDQDSHLSQSRKGTYDVLDDDSPSLCLGRECLLTK